MPTAVTPAMIVGAALFMLGGAWLVATYFVGSQLALGMAGLRNLRAHLATHPRARRRAWVAAGMVALGGALTLGSVMMGDLERNRRCRTACRERGFNSGRFRASPHTDYAPGDPYGCWCHQDATNWSAQPVPF